VSAQLIIRLTTWLNCQHASTASSSEMREMRTNGYVRKNKIWKVFDKAFDEVAA
jgi:hypothetical protein